MSDLDLTAVKYIATELRSHAAIASRARQTAELCALAARVEQLPDLIAAQVREQIAQEIEAEQSAPYPVFGFVRGLESAARIARGGAR